MGQWVQYTVLDIALRPDENGSHSADDIFKHLFLKEKFHILIKISLKFLPKCPIDNIVNIGLSIAW